MVYSRRHEQQSDVAVEFLDFYNSNGDNNIKYLVFDSKFTTYANLAKLGKEIKFLTIRRRGKKIVEELNKKPSSSWKKVRVAMANGKGRNLKDPSGPIVIVYPNLRPTAAFLASDRSIPEKKKSSKTNLIH